MAAGVAEPDPASASQSGRDPGACASARFPAPRVDGPEHPDRRRRRAASPTSASTAGRGPAELGETAERRVAEVPAAGALRDATTSSGSP